MALKEPKTEDIAEQLVANFESAFGQSVPLLPKAFLRVFAKVMAAVIKILYKRSNWQYLQLFPSTASSEALQDWGNRLGVFRSNPSVAKIQIEVVGVDGASVNTGTLFSSNDLGILFTSEGNQAIIEGKATITVRCNVLGTVGNLPVGSKLTMTTPIPDIDLTATALNTAILGHDLENIEDYRVRVQNAFKKTRRGGALADYFEWATEIPSIINAWPYSGDLAGTAEVYVESGVEVDGIPTVAEIQAVKDNIELPDNRPTTADVYVLPITRKAFTVKIKDLSNDTPDIRLRIENALTAYFLDREPYVKGLSDKNKSTVYQAEITGIVADALELSGGHITDAVFYESQASGNAFVYGLQKGEKVKLGGVIYS